MNKIIIIGRITKDTELKTTNNGTEVCNFTVAVDRFAKKGEEKQTDFIDVTAWGKTAAFVDTYFMKGSPVVVEGRMESRKWEDKDGNKRTSWGITAEKIEFAPSTKKMDNGGISDPVLSEIGTEDGELPF